MVRVVRGGIGAGGVPRCRRRANSASR